MPQAWKPYISKAKSRIERIENTIDRLDKGYQKVKRNAEATVKAGLMGWLSTVPKQERSRGNAFSRIAPNANIRVAYNAIDAGMSNIVGLAQRIPYRAGGNVIPEQAQNIYVAAGIMAEEAEELADELELDDEGFDFDDAAEVLLIDNALNISGIITRDGRRIKEEITRTVSSGEAIATIGNRIKNFAINNSFYRLSTVAHPRAIVRNYTWQATAATVAAGIMLWPSKDDIRWTVLPNTEGSSRLVDEQLAYRVFTSRELDARYRDMVKADYPGADWKGLGLSYNTNEYYIPIWPEQEDEAEEWSKEQRTRIRGKL